MMIKNKKFILTIMIVILITVIVVIVYDGKDVFIGKWKDRAGISQITKNGDFYEMKTKFIKYENGVVEDELLKFKDIYGRIYAYKYENGNLISYYYKNHVDGKKTLEKIGVMERIE